MNFGDELERSDTIISMGIPAAAAADQILTTTTSPALQPAFNDISCEAAKTTTYNNCLGLLDALYPSQDNYYTVCSNATPSSEVVNSSSSNDHQQTTKTVEDKTTKKQLKLKNKNQKSRQREAKFAFMTKSEVDHLDDGYRWRKYGQKPVKNTHFPRSYYRCTTGSCGVKKRVERWYEDPSIVVTTYEGTHTHPCPIIKHSGSPIIPPATTLFKFPSGGITRMMSKNNNNNNRYYCYDDDNEDVIVPPHQLHYPPPPPTTTYFHPAATITTYATSGAYANSSISTLMPQQTLRLLPPSLSLIPDHGLLQDMVPSHMVKVDTNKH